MVIDHLITPYKYGLPVLSGSGVEGAFDSMAVDCPTVFRHNDFYYMTYVGFDGRGYQTGLARSTDLLDWEKLGVILARGSNMAWDSVGQAGVCLLMETGLWGERRLKKYDGKYWLIYHAYPGEGYEAGAAETGLAYTEDESLLSWTFVGEPVFSHRDGAAWERGGLYKSWVIEHEGRFYMYYNAKNDPAPGERWLEQTGMAVSDDLLHWTRPYDRPVLPVTPGAWDSVFASDPQVCYDEKEKQWVMFYYGFDGKRAMDGIAVSDDLYTWRKFPLPTLLTGARDEIDSRYAHKPGVIARDGELYHFYCACRPSQPGDPARNGNEFRCISVASTGRF